MDLGVPGPVVLLVVLFLAFVCENLGEDELVCCFAKVLRCCEELASDARERERGREGAQRPMFVSFGAVEYFKQDLVIER